MTKTIAELWNGNIDPVKRVGRKNSEIKQLENLMQRNLEKIEEVLKEKEIKILERYCDCQNEYIAIMCEESFCDGFSLGTKLAAEGLIEAEKFTVSQF